MSGRNGMSLESWRRSLKLQVTTAQIGLERMRALLGAKALVKQLPELAAMAAGSPEEEKRVERIRADLEATLSAELESARLGKKSTLDLQTLDDVLEGKALRECAAMANFTSPVHVDDAGKIGTETSTTGGPGGPP